MKEDANFIHKMSKKYFGECFDGLDIRRCSFDDFKVWYQQSHRTDEKAPYEFLYALATYVWERYW